ncbi:hypothetical protein ACF07D_05950 [Leucobacter sp. NPDC015123]|uniref:hypothetical protein n=1 Tax=Leucobacter sp. NPDC015123 TaxID=3364129 RepID=UPI0036F47574
MTMHPAPTGPASPKRGLGVVGIVTAVVGGVVLLGLGASAAVGMALSSQRVELSQSAAGTMIDATGVTDLDLNVGVAELTLQFGAVEGATLEARGGSADKWELDRAGDSITVRAPKVDRSGFCFLGVCPSNRGQHVQATLTLPNELADRTIDADIRVGVGEVQAAGRFGELNLKVDAGEATVSGSATSLNATVGVGTVQGELSDVQTVDADVSLGDLDLRLTGAQPVDVGLNVSAGSISLEVPDGVYDVVQRGGIGTIENRLTTTPGAPHKISAQVELGDILLRATR